jgi:ABC transport system ATP-binding/permease protein
MAILVSAHKLEKGFASRTIFRSLTFAVESGDRIGLIGPNGAGKSTLMKILARQSSADGGDLTFGRGIRVAYLPQDPEFKAGETVREALVAAVDDPYDYENLNRIDELMSKLDLNRPDVNEDSVVSSLSGGWKKRVALARELVRNPDLLLLDEPTNHLDVEAIRWLEDFLAEATFATMTVTHDRLFLQRVANRIFDLDPRYPEGLLVVKGEYVEYLTVRDELIRSQERREVVLKNTLRRETEWLRRGAKARTTKGGGSRRRSRRPRNAEREETSAARFPRGGSKSAKTHRSRRPEENLSGSRRKAANAVRESRFHRDTEDPSRALGSQRRR